MYISPRKFFRHEIVFPRSTGNGLLDPTENVFQETPIRNGPHTVISGDGATRFRLSPRQFSTPNSDRIGLRFKSTV